MYRKFLILALIVMVLAACNQQATPDQVMGDAARGSEIFHKGVNGAPACAGCHATTKASLMRGGVGIAPNLSGLTERAPHRIEGLSAQEYVLNSILNPSGFVVEGFQNVMYPGYAEQLSQQDLTDLLAYLLTL